MRKSCRAGRGSMSWPGAKVEVEGYTRPGQVVLISETADGATQTILVRAEVPNNGELRPGQTAQARIGFSSSVESAWELPYSALIRRGEQASVFVIMSGGFRLVAVTLLEEDQDHVVVSGPITDKDEVAAGGISALRGILLKLGAGWSCSRACHLRSLRGCSSPSACFLWPEPDWCSCLPI